MSITMIRRYSRLLGLPLLLLASSVDAATCPDSVKIHSFRSLEEVKLYEDIAINLHAHLQDTLYDDKLDRLGLNIKLSFESIPKSLSPEDRSDPARIEQAIAGYRESATGYMGNEEAAAKYLRDTGAMQLYSFTRLTEDRSAQSLVFLGESKGGLRNHYKMVTLANWRDPDSLPVYANQFSVLLLYGLIKPLQDCEIDTAPVNELIRTLLVDLPDKTNTNSFRKSVLRGLNQERQAMQSASGDQDQ